MLPTIEEILGKCEKKVITSREYFSKIPKKLPIKCYACDGFASTAQQIGCQDYRPFLRRHIVQQLQADKKRIEPYDQGEVPI